MIINFIAVILVCALVWAYFDVRIIKFYDYVTGLKKKYEHEKHMELEILAIQSEMLVKNVKKKIINLYEEYEVNIPLASALDDHLHWVLRESKFINKLAAPGLMKKRFEQLTLMEQEKWSVIEEVLQLQS